MKPFGEAGPSKPPPGETFPGARPPVLHTVLQIRYARGPAPGNFFWGRMNFGNLRTGAADWMDAMEIFLRLDIQLAMCNEQ